MDIKRSYNKEGRHYSPIINDLIKATLETILTNQKNRPDRLRKCSDVTQAQHMSPPLKGTCWSIQIVGNYSQPGVFPPLLILRTLKDTCITQEVFILFLSSRSDFVSLSRSIRVRIVSTEQVYALCSFSTEEFLWLRRCAITHRWNIWQPEGIDTKTLTTVINDQTCLKRSQLCHK